MGAHNKDECDSTEDEADLDGPLESQSQRHVSNAARPLHRKSTSPKPPSPPRAGGFRIGGRPGSASPSPPPLCDDRDVGPKPDDVLMTRESVPPSPKQPDINTTPKKTRNFFRIGGKGRVVDPDSSQCANTSSLSKNRTRTQSPTVGPPSSPPSEKAAKEATPVQEVVEETPEEKAERRRAELKRRNEEAAKKLAQQKKKKRF